jgi:23S rRNA pseudouridine2605 synthase
MKRTDNFQKFVKQKKGSAVKEEIRQEKKKEKRERAEAIEKHFAKKRAEKLQKSPPEAPVKKAPANKYPKVKNAPAASTKIVENTTTGETMPVNKYIAHGGLCSRRDAAVLVKEGQVLVNGQVATDPGMKVSAADVVKVNGKKITPTQNFVYILLNKPKDYLTTADDPQGRKTVLDLIKQATTERVYPVGRLDRNTSGVLLLTNDGELAQKLTHPKHEIKKVYEVRLDRALTKGDMDKIASGVTLEDGFVAPDVIAYADPMDKSIIGIEIHSGRNRIVRRIFEHFKYDVKGLDRVMFAGLTKKNVQRGKWRFLNEKEIRILKFMNQSFVKVNN